MKHTTPDDINILCEKWLKESTLPEGGFSISHDSEKYRLLTNSIKFHELNHEALCSALIGLTRVLIHPGCNSIVSNDHIMLWAWCGELITGPLSQVYSVDQYQIKNLYQTAIHAALANCRNPLNIPKTRAEAIEQSKIQQLQPYHSREFLHKSHLILAYLGFPLLEAVLKRSCSKYIQFDGTVIKKFSVPGRNGNPKIYDVAKPGKQRNSCSSMRDLLLLHSAEVAAPELKILINQFGTHLKNIDPAQEPFDLIYSWRNQSLHGSTSFNTIGGTILSLSLLISLFEIRDIFEQHRSKMAENCIRDPRFAMITPSSFYPPY